MDRDAGGGRDAAARALRESKAERFFAVVDGEPREVKAARTRGRWERLVAASIALGASAIECRDTSGATLAVVELDDEEPRETIAAAPERPAPSGSAGEVERLLGLVLRAQDAAVSRQAEQVKQITDAALSVMQAAADRASSMERAVLSLVQQRERELDATAQQLDAELRAAAREAQATARAKAEETEEAGELDAMASKLMTEAVTPALQAKVMQLMAGGGKKAS